VKDGTLRSIPGLCLCLCLCSQSPTGALAQALDKAEPSPLESLQAQIAEAKKNLSRWEDKAAEDAAALESAPNRIAALDEAIEQLEQREEPSPPADATVKELQSQLAAAELELRRARQELATLDAEVAQRAERRRSLPAQLDETKTRLLALESRPPPPPNDSPELEAAQEELTNLRLAALRAEVESRESQLQGYEVRGLLLDRRRDYASLRTSREEKTVEALRAALIAKQRVEVEQLAAQTEDLLQRLGTPSEEVRRLVQEIAEQNSQLAQRWTGEDGVSEKIEDVSDKLARADAQIADVDAALNNLQEQIAAVGLADSVGLMLRRQRADAPDVGMYRRFIAMRQPVIGSVQLEQIQLRERRQALVDLDEAIDEALSPVSQDMSQAERERVRGVLRDLLQTQREYLDELIDDYGTYFEKLVDFDARQRELVTRTQRLTEFIDARVLWVPSGGPFHAEAVSQLAPATQWFFAKSNWVQLGQGFAELWRRAPARNLLVLLLVLASILAAPRIRKRIDAYGDTVRSFRNVSFVPTLAALGWTHLLVPWLPGTLIYFGWELGRSPAATQFSRSFASGFVAAGLFWLSLRWVRGILLPNGVAEAHCGFSKEVIASIRRRLLWLLLITVPAVFVIFTYEARGEDGWTESVGRLAFLIAMLSVATFTYWLIGPRGPMRRSQLLEGNATGVRLWFVLRLLAVLVPIALIVAAMRGFYWTALQLAFRHHLTLLLFFFLSVTFRLSVRWSLIASRRVAREQAKQRLDTQEEDAVDLVAAAKQTGRLMKGLTGFALLVGLLLIWADVLPAAGFLDSVELWDSTQDVTVSVEDATGAARQTTERQVVPVTLADLLVAILIAAATLALVGNLPGLLEVTLLRRFTAGERYAYKTLIKYAIAMTGFALSLAAIGLNWNSIQWLVAAFGVGLGFGLQEIFANFISGLIILFERPIRVGDVVTVGTVNGTVSKIRTRATWITAFDRRELLVPNKEFVTQQLINWSLSDSTLRVDIPVGIAYGSDTARAVAVLESVARSHPKVISDPPPQVLFLAFGDSSLGFELRVFLASIEEFQRVKHELFMAVDAAFREAGIEIAFPQRDLHIRSIPEVWQPATRPSGSA
jgi:potassium efflux system protein